jgi:hypothetical protein
MSRSRTRRGIRSIPRIDSPDLSGIDMHSLAVRYILITATMPDGLFPDEVTQGMVNTLNKESRNSPPWLKMQAHEVHPGDVVDIDSMLPGVLREHEVDYFLEAVDDEQARRVASILLQRVERIDELAAAEAEQEAQEKAEQEATDTAAAHATATRINAECGVPTMSQQGL